MPSVNKPNYFWHIIIIVSIVIISLLHYNTPTMDWQYHLVYMQAYFIPIILAAFQFGTKGGIGTAVLISIIYFPHIILQWGGLIENNMMRFLQIVLFNVVGFITGLKAQGERQEKERYHKTADNLKKSLQKLKGQSAHISEMEEQIRAADRLAIVGELTASLAHEVRNPLGSIRGAVEIIRNAVPEDVKKLEFFDILIHETERLNQVVETYLGFSKKQSRQFSTYNLNETIQNIVLMIGPQARKNKITIKTSLPQETVFLKGDPNHLWQVILNVVLNAIQASSGNSEIVVKGELVNEDGGIKKQNTRVVRVSIADQGEGIDPAKIKDIFKAFYTTKSNGTGLGLAIVKRISDENHWQMEVNSRPGDGAEFVFTIPVNK